MEKFKFLEETIKQLGLSRQEVIDYLSENCKNTSNVHSNTIVVSKLVDILQVKPGMFWFEDDTFSYERQENKKIKSIVELVDNATIYGDLTASELFDIKEEHLDWHQIKNRIEQYPCKKNENIVWCGRNWFEKVYATYGAVKKAFCKLNKPYRDKAYVTCSIEGGNKAWIFSFKSGHRWSEFLHVNYYYRPVLALKIS